MLLVGIALVLALSAGKAGASFGATPQLQAAGLQSVIVRTTPGSEGKARLAVARLGGRIGMRLAIINGFAAKVPASQVGRLRGLPFVLAVSPNAMVRSLAADYSGVNTTSELGSMARVTQITGAQEYWKAGYTGKGIGVALIDTGVAPVDGLTTAGKVVNGPDLSFDSQDSTKLYVDKYGHGTHMAGIIAGRASLAVSGRYAGDQKNFLGMAPDAKIVNVKVGDSEGSTDVSQMIAAIGWVVQHRNDAGLNIRVLNMSFGTDSNQPYTVDPLAYAVEQAVKAGIVVVAATGNAGFSRAGTLANPASDPFTIAVGAAESNGTAATGDDSVASFSSVGSVSSNGSKSRGPDLVAPGAHIISLRAPGSYADVNYPGGYVNTALFRGSGTSQSTAVVSGAAALILEQRPMITPDQLKKLLMNSASSLKGESASAQGNGELNLAGALTLSTPMWSVPDAPSTGGGSLELSRGSLHVQNSGNVLQGERDIFGMTFDAATMALLEATGSSWSGGMWNGSSWSGSSWSGSSWSGSSWSASSWSASSWSGSSWSSSSWSSAGWLGASWD